MDIKVTTFQNLANKNDSDKVQCDSYVRQTYTKLKSGYRLLFDAVLFY